MPTNKIDMSKPSATLPIKEPIATKNDPNKRGNQIRAPHGARAYP